MRIDHDVLIRYDDHHFYSEAVGIEVSENYLQERKDRGLKLKISGKGGEEVFWLPAEYISAFLQAIERHANR